MRLTGVIALALLAYLAALAAPIGMADLTAFGPRQTLARAERPFPLPADAEWLRGQELLSKALALDPGNPNFAENLARWHERAASRLPARSPDAAAHLRQSLRYFRRAAAARPSSPYTWSNIALIKLRLAEIDDELARAVTNSTQFGPWEPEVELAIADVMFIAGERLSPEARLAGRKLLINALRHQDEKLYERAVRYGRLALLCSLPGAATARFAFNCI